MHAKAGQMGESQSGTCRIVLKTVKLTCSECCRFMNDMVQMLRSRTLTKESCSHFGEAQDNREQLDKPYSNPEKAVWH